MNQSDESIEYTWADAWFLLAVSYASPNGEKTELSSIIGAADFINHAILTYREIESATHKLTCDGWIEFRDTSYFATRKMIDQFQCLPEGAPMKQMDAVRQWLGATGYDEGYDPNATTEYTFPAITQAMVDSATRRYTQR